MNINRKCNPISRKFKILARGPLLLLGMSHFALHKMFAECMFSQGVIVFDYQASMFCICKNFTRCTFSWRVIVFDYQASMLCISKTFCKTYVVWMSHILLHRCVIVTCKMTVMLQATHRCMPPVWQLCLLQCIQQNTWYCVVWNIWKLYQYIHVL